MDTAQQTNRIAIRRRVRKKGRTDISGCAWPGIDHDRLPELARKRFGNDPSHDVMPARWDRHDQVQRLQGIGLGESRVTERQRKERAEQFSQTVFYHLLSSLCWLAIASR